MKRVGEDKDKEGTKTKTQKKRGKYTRRDASKRSRSSETLVWAGTGPLGFSTRILQGASDVITS